MAIFLLIFAKNICWDAHSKHLMEMIQMSTHNMFSWRNIENG